MKRLLTILLTMFAVSPALAAVTVVVNGSNYTIPQTNEKGWGANVTSWIQAITLNSLQPIGGNFLLTNDVNFGTNYGLISPYFKSRTINIAGSGALRLANTDSVSWRNAANSADIALAVNGSNQLQFSGSTIPTLTSGLLPISLGGTNSGTSLVGNRAIASSGTAIVESATTSTELGYVSGVTSSLCGTNQACTETNKSISGSANTITNVSLVTGVTGTLPIANGGTGQITANAALNALLPSQTSNNGKYLQTNGTSTTWAGSTVVNTAPTVQKFLSGSGTYTTPGGVLYIRVRECGGGGGGSGSGTAAGSAASAGGNSTFGTSLIVANGGGQGVWANAGTAVGGTASLGTGPVGVAVQGMGGGPNQYSGTTSNDASGGAGGASAFGGAGPGGSAGSGGTAAVGYCSGGGGGGGSAVANLFTGNGGASGGFVDAIITSPSASYPYAVGAAGSAGGAGTSGSAGGAGFGGVLIVEEFYQ